MHKVKIESISTLWTLPSPSYFDERNFRMQLYSNWNTVDTVT